MAEPVEHLSIAEIKHVSDDTLEGVRLLIAAIKDTYSDQCADCVVRGITAALLAGAAACGAETMRAEGPMVRAQSREAFLQLAAQALKDALGRGAPRVTVN